MAKSSYGSADITQIEFLEAIRKLPGMYIGDTEEHGLHHILLEVVDNSIDECQNGYAQGIYVTIEKDGTISVADDGRGIPVEYKPDIESSALTVVLTKPHAGGKFSKNGEESAYSASGGLHGIGLKCTNAMSTRLVARIKRHGLVFVQTFENGGGNMTGVEIFDSTLKKVGEIDANTKLSLDKNGICDALIVKGKKIPVVPNLEQGTGTEISFRPNRAWFSTGLQWDNPDKTVPWNSTRLETRFNQISFLHPGIKIEFLDKRIAALDRQKKIFFSKEGLKDYIAYLNEGLKPLHKPIMFDSEDKMEINGVLQSIKLNVVLQYTADENGETNLVSFVNSIPTPLGGVHVSSFRSGFSRAINTVAVAKKWVKSADDFKNDDVFAGLSGVIVLTMTHTPQFLSQTKEQLNSNEVKGPIISATYNYLSDFFSKPANAEIGRLIVSQAMTAKESRDAAQKIRKASLNKSGLESGFKIAGNVADITRSGDEPIVPKEYTALYIVEGDSAGGSAKQGRDRRFHGIAPLRGKPKNSWQEKVTTVLDNEELSSLVTIIGAGISPSFELENMRYGRIVIMADADVDGSHIRALLITFFWRFMRPLVEAGKLYAARPPLFLIKQKKGGGREYSYTEAERDEVIKRFGGLQAVEITRYKGLGEMDAEQLSETVLVVPPGYAKNRGVKKVDRHGEDENTAYSISDFAYRDVKLTVDDVHKANEVIGLWMGNKPKERNEWLMNHPWVITAE